MKTQYTQPEVTAVEVDTTVKAPDIHEGDTKGQLLEICEQMGIPMPVMLTKKEISRKIEAAKKIKAAEEIEILTEGAQWYSARMDTVELKCMKLAELRATKDDWKCVTVTREQASNGMFPMLVEIAMNNEEGNGILDQVIRAADWAQSWDNLFYTALAEAYAEDLARKERAVQTVPVDYRSSLLSECSHWDEIQEEWDKANPRRSRNLGKTAVKQLKSAKKASLSADGVFLREVNKNASTARIDTQNAAVVKPQVFDLLAPKSNNGRERLRRILAQNAIVA